MKILMRNQGLLLLFTLISFVSCGGQNSAMLRNVDIDAKLEGKEVLVGINAELGIGNLILPNITMPILKPNSDKVIGELSLMSLAGGKNHLLIDLNLSILSKLELAPSSLPNGHLIPLIGVSDVIEVAVNDKVTLYLSFMDGNIVLGVAVPIKNFDSIGEKIGQSSLFPLFVKNEVISAAGIYTSKRKGLNGFGFFTDLSSKLSDEMRDEISALQFQHDDNLMNIRSIKPSSWKRRKINRALFRLHKKAAKLKI